MCGITGFVNFEKNIHDSFYILKNMCKTLEKDDSNDEDFYFSKHSALAHKRLSAIDVKNEKPPMTFIYQGKTYTIVYNGQLYNTIELRQELKRHGFEFKSNSETEVLLKSYIHYGKDVCKFLNGVFSFAIWNNDDEELFIARDQFGIKPLYYCVINNYLVFASEIKAILEFPMCKAILDKQGISELFGIGPSHTPGLTPFKNIFELEPAHYIIYNKNGLFKKEYWSLKTKPHEDNFETTCEKIKFLIKDSVERQLISDVPLCTLLSGGLDSSIITSISSNYYKEKYNEQLNTFSVDYVDQDKNFVKNDFQPDLDDKYINLMVETFRTNHHKILLDTPELFSELENSMMARDFPGMADVDSSYLLFFRKIKKHATIALSGECSDEIFGGYPWYFRKDSLESNTFPWSLAIKERQQLLHPYISQKVNLKDYITEKYQKSINKVEFLDTDSDNDILHRKLIYLTSNWFMQTLLDRTDRMAMAAGFEVRVPFCDYRIVEYLWNIPWEMKAYKGREKGLLRYCMEDFLPKEIIYRKKSPYPKTHNPNYLATVKEALTKIVNDNKSPINEILNTSYIKEILETNGKNFSRPWFGQLMTGPQLMAYLIQVNMWLERYNPEFEI